MREHTDAKPECDSASNAPTIYATKQKAEEIVNVTKNATKKISQFLEKENKSGWALRIQAVPGGCAGFTYFFKFDQTPLTKDTVIEQNGVKVFIDEFSKNLFKGSTLDYVETLQSSGFVVKNPNVQKTCGCGHSFG